jgi:ectoine hydroxylase-related dioxygenase (phytanoyl-CoA dioxygenase family)|eukprot:COSAG01_NODE_50_length_31487_cov_90.470243_34_plen_77_part_00
MPNCVEAALPAGWGIAFDSHIWHTSMPNTSGVDRRCAYFAYRSSGRYWPELPKWGSAAGLSEETLRRLDRESRTAT